MAVFFLQIAFEKLGRLCGYIIEEVNQAIKITELNLMKIISEQQIHLSESHPYRIIVIKNISVSILVRMTVRYKYKMKVHLRSVFELRQICRSLQPR